MDGRESPWLPLIYQPPNDYRGLTGSSEPSILYNHWWLVESSLTPWMISIPIIHRWESENSLLTFAINDNHWWLVEMALPESWILYSHRSLRVENSLTHLCHQMAIIDWWVVESSLTPSCNHQSIIGIDWHKWASEFSTLNVGMIGFPGW